MNTTHTFKFGSWTSRAALLLLLVRGMALQAASHSYQLSDGTSVTLDRQGSQSVITLNGQPNSIYKINATEDLSQWTTLEAQANLGAAGTFTFTDTRALPKCFYRVTTHVTTPGQALQQNLASGGGNKMDIKIGQRGAQSFRHGVAGGPNYFITKVVLYLSREAEPSDSDLQVGLGTGMNSGEIAGSGVSIAPALITDASAGLTFIALPIVYPAPVGPLTAGTTYYLNLQSDAPNTKAIYVEYAPGDVYPEGTFYKNEIDDAKDVRFELWGGVGP